MYGTKTGGLIAPNAIVLFSSSPSCVRPKPTDSTKTGKKFLGSCGKFSYPDPHPALEATTVPDLINLHVLPVCLSTMMTTSALEDKILSATQAT